MKVRNARTGHIFEVPEGTPPQDYHKWDTSPPDLKAQIEAAGKGVLGGVQGVLGRAREGTTQRMTQTPGGQPAMGATATEIAKGINPIPRSLPTLAGMGAAMAVPGTRPILGPLARAAAGTAAASGTAMALGQDPLEAALGFGIPQAISEAGFGLGRLALNPKTLEQFGRVTAGKLADLVKKNVPAWAPFASDAKGLSQMIYGQEGRNALHEAYDRALSHVIQSGRGQQVVIPVKDAAVFKLEPRGQVSSPQGTLDHVTVDADALAVAMTGQWKKHPGEYRRAANALDAAGIGDPKARGEYKYGTGIGVFLDKTKALEGEIYHPERAMRGLSTLKTVEELNRRGMGGEAARTIRGPGKEPIESFRITPWSKRLFGGTIGETAGIAAGRHGYGLPGLAGAGAAEILIPDVVSKNVPLGPLAKQIIQRGPTAVAGGGRLIGEQLLGGAEQP